MLGHLNKSEFNPTQNYDSFYQGHRFEPMPEPQCYMADLVVPRVGWALDIARSISAEHVLDLGCLDGFTLLSLANRLHHLAGTGVDLSKPGIKLAQERADAKHFKLRFIEGRVEDFRDEVGYDLVLLFETIEHVTNLEDLMEAIKANLHPGGTLLVSTPDAEGYYGIRNVEDTCHLQVFTHRRAPDPDWPRYPTGSPVVKPVISLPDFLEEHGFHVESTDVWSDLVHCRAVLR